MHNWTLKFLHQEERQITKLWLLDKNIAVEITIHKIFKKFGSLDPKKSVLTKYSPRNRNYFAQNADNCINFELIPMKSSAAKYL